MNGRDRQRSISLVGRLGPQRSRGPHSLACDRRPFPGSQVPGQCPDPSVAFPRGQDKAMQGPLPRERPISVWR